MRNAVLIAAALALVVCAVAWCQGGPRPGGPGGPGPICQVGAVLPPPAAASDLIAKDLKMTAAQAAALKDVLTKSEATIFPLLQAAGDASKALHEAVFATRYDADAAAQAAATAQSAEAAVVTASIDAWARIRSTLTADQFAKLQAGPPPGPGCPPPGGPPPGGQGRRH